jgi:hypothetical protein
VFDDRATAFSGQFWATKHRTWLALLGAGITAFAYTMVSKSRARGKRKGVVT